ncbi:MAG: hypothetical protein ABL961_15270 [Vicinamibacterales bacterium]
MKRCAIGAGPAGRDRRMLGDELDDAHPCFGYKPQDTTVAGVLQLPEQRGGTDIELLGGQRPAAVDPPERREDVLALQAPQWTNVL